MACARSRRIRRAPVSGRPLRTSCTVHRVREVDDGPLLRIVADHGEAGSLQLLERRTTHQLVDEGQRHRRPHGKELEPAACCGCHRSDVRIEEVLQALERRGAVRQVPAPVVPLDAPGAAQAVDQLRDVQRVPLGEPVDPLVGLPRGSARRASRPPGPPPRPWTAAGDPPVRGDARATGARSRRVRARCSATSRAAAPPHWWRSRARGKRTTRRATGRHRPAPRARLRGDRHGSRRRSRRSSAPRRRAAGAPPHRRAATTTRWSRRSGRPRGRARARRRRRWRAGSCPVPRARRSRTHVPPARRRPLAAPHPVRRGRPTDPPMRAAAGWPAAAHRHPCAAPRPRREGTSLRGGRSEVDEHRHHPAVGAPDRPGGRACRRSGRCGSPPCGSSPRAARRSVRWSGPGPAGRAHPAPSQ